MRTASLIFLGMLFLCLATGCSNREVERARRLEAQGKYLEAALAYQQLLPGLSYEPRKQSELSVRIGDLMLHGQRPQEAFNAFQKATELDQSNTVAHLRLAQLYVAGNTPDKAYEHLQKVLKQQPDQPDALAGMGDYYSSIGQTEKAEQEFQRVLALQPGRQSIAVALAELYGSSGQISKAREVLTSSAKANKTDPVAWLALGRLEERQGNGDAAESAYRNAVLAEDSAETNVRLAQFLLRATKVKEAEEVLGRADSRRPLQSTWAADFQLSSGHAVRAAVEYMSALQGRLAGRHERDPEQTAAVASRAIEADLEVARHLSLTTRAGAEGVQSQTALARIHLDAYRANLDPTTIQVLETELALVAGDLARAATTAHQAVVSGPDSPAAHFVLGEVYQNQGDESAAIASWNTALGYDEGYIPALLAIGHFEYAHKQYPSAEEHAAAVVRHDPASLEALLLYARALAADEQFAAARSVAERARALARHSAEPYVVLGEIEMKQQRLGAALLYFQQAILINSRSQTAVEGLAAVYRHAIVDPRMIAKLERTADTPPRSSALMEIAGRLYAGHHLYNDAARCLKRSIEIDHRQVTAAMVLAETAVEQKKDHGLDQLESMVEELGGSAQSLLAAVKAQDENQLDLAMEKYEAAVRQREHSGVAANNLAWLYAQRGQNLDRALELARSAHDSDPKNLAIMDTLGFVHLVRREYSQAVAVLKDATLLAKNKQMASVDEETRSSLRKHLAEAYLRIGQPEDADSALRNK